MRANLYLKLLSIAMALTLGACGGKEQQQGAAQQALPFPIVKVGSKQITGYSSYPASIEGIVNSDIRAKVSGYIKQVLVDEGEKVRAGQPLFRLETASLSQDAEAAKASVNAAQVEVDRLGPLVEKGIVSNVQLETAKAKLAQAKSTYNSITANIGYATVKSPIDGYVGAIPYRVGSLISPADPTPLTTVSDISEVYAYFSMNEKDYLDFIQNAEGETLQDKLDNLPAVNLQLANGSIYKEKGKIQTVTGQVNQSTGTVSFRAIFENPNLIVTNGNSGKVLIPTTYTDAPVIPQAATFERQGQILVYHVKEDNTVSADVVEIKDRIDNLYVVKSGVKVGDVIVSDGVGKLRPNMPIVPQEVPYDSVVKPLETVFK
ncbi:efflux RND transporter periplasmic adaptor subunit [Galbibacter sp.]|uniref:efflux RND transporter periplasmic adaptor subunit n=1 Tax=Galbibacter sp. TaxID=2918471 RepID=UPI002D1FA38D|nr:efflux RND transporter periplasmic adaptor subunit [Galbibacter sp.]